MQTPKDLYLIRTEIEVKVATLEANIGNINQTLIDIKNELKEIRSELKEIRKDAKHDFIYMIAFVSAVGCGLWGIMAKGFHWFI